MQPSDENPMPSFINEAPGMENSQVERPGEKKSQSPLMELENFNIITGFVPEYQHSVCLGPTRQHTSLWLDSKHCDKDW